MRNHNEKIKDIAESLLPSRAYKYARVERQQIHRRNRRRINEALGCLEDDFLPEERIDLFDDAHTEIRYMMYERRGADNLGAFLKWAEATTRHIEDPHEKYRHVKRLMPDNLISRHALTHLPYEWREDVNRPRYTYYPSKPVWRPDAREIARILRERIDRPGFHSKLNRTIKDSFRRVNAHEFFDRAQGVWKSKDCDCESHLRLLFGIHDIDAFAEFYGGPRRWRAPHGETHDAVLKMLS